MLDQRRERESQVDKPSLPTGWRVEFGDSLAIDTRKHNSLWDLI